jgi:hypothetical protein
MAMDGKYIHRDKKLLDIRKCNHAFPYNFILCSFVLPRANSLSSWQRHMKESAFFARHTCVLRHFISESYQRADASSARTIESHLHQLHSEFSQRAKIFLLFSQLLHNFTGIARYTNFLQQ